MDVVVSSTSAAHLEYLLRIADSSLILGHRLSEWCGHGPVLEEDIALTNVALDLIGQARLLYTRAGALEDGGRSEDQFAFNRTESEFRNVTMVELPNGDYGSTIMRNFLFTAFQLELWPLLQASADAQLAEIAGKSRKEAQYHAQHASDWTVRLGDGTDESHTRMQRALDTLWPYTAEFFSASTTDDAAAESAIGPAWSSLEARWHAAVRPVLDVATLRVPERTIVPVARQGGPAQRAHGAVAARDAVSATYLPEPQLVVEVRGLMTPRYHTLRIADVRRETPECISVTFDLPPELAPAYRFVQGQHLGLRTTLDGEELRRSYSICSGVDDGEIRVAIKKVGGGKFSHWANEALKPGDPIEVLTPEGRFFTPLDPAHGKHYVAFVAGSGITPVLSLIRTTLAREPKSRFTLVYGNRRQSSVMFHEALEDLKDRYLTRFSLYNVFSREAQEVELFNGRIDAAKVNQFLESLVPSDTIDEAFICGPLTMIDDVEVALIAAGVPANHVHVERFGIPTGSTRGDR